VILCDATGDNNNKSRADSRVAEPQPNLEHLRLGSTDDSKVSNHQPISSRCTGSFTLLELFDHHVLELTPETVDLANVTVVLICRGSSDR